MNAINETWAGIVMAAGSGTRMGTDIMKPLHRLSGRPLIEYSLRALMAAGIDSPIVLRDSKEDLVNALAHLDLKFLIQNVKDGTGGALAPILDGLPGNIKNIIVVNADTPFVTDQSIVEVVKEHLNTSAVFSFLVSEEDSHNDRGVVVFNETRQPTKIEENYLDNDDSDDKYLVNVGVYCINIDWLKTSFDKLTLQDNGEKYITELLDLAVDDGSTISYALVGDENESLGVNTLIDLAQAEKIQRVGILNKLMLSGIIIEDPGSTYVEDTVEVGKNTVIRPGTFLRGETIIGANCDIGPNTEVTDSSISDQCRVWNSIIEQSVLDSTVTVGPYSHIRPESHLSAGVKVGNFSEIKASELGENVTMSHFGYAGDASIGDNVNLGAGMVTCNYDGANKHRTEIGEGAFIGSDTMLVAPLKVGSGAITGAGSVVINDVASGETVAGVPARVSENNE
jgi:bifunctional UDP-N-acetylglucosamine pyrophosphorylase/glucosamine-1-phosphate N-acetyltransferase